MWKWWRVWNIDNSFNTVVLVHVAIVWEVKFCTYLLFVPCTCTALSMQTCKFVFSRWNETLFCEEVNNKKYRLNNYLLCALVCNGHHLFWRCLQFVLEQKKLFYKWPFIVYWKFQPQNKHNKKVTIYVGLWALTSKDPWARDCSII